MFVEIANTPRDFAWGSATAIAELLGVQPSGRPEAELWLGTHPGSPARVVGDGRALHEVTGTRLPFLLKVLAAAQPLSLQVHPDADQAAAGFAREEAAGIPIDAPHRTYKDPHPKPELLYALSDPFRALAGFRRVAETREVLAPVADDPRIAPLVERLGDDAELGPVVAWLIRGGAEVDALVAAVVEAAATQDGPSWRAVRTLAEHHPGDPGIAISLLLHTVELHPGEVLSLPAGTIHAYLEGLGVELMISSDNVLRGGLSTKHVDADELLRVMDARPLPAPYLAPEEPQPGVRVLRPDDPGFVLTAVSSEAAVRGVELRLDGPAILLCTAGSLALEGGPRVTAGRAVYIDGEPWLGIRGEGAAFVASAG